MLSPNFTGAANSFIPIETGIDFNIFPLRNPGLISIPFGFFMGWLGTVPLMKTTLHTTQSWRFEA